MNTINANQLLDQLQILARQAGSSSSAAEARTDWEERLRRR